MNPYGLDVFAHHVPPEKSRRASRVGMLFPMGLHSLEPIYPKCPWCASHTGLVLFHFLACNVTEYPPQKKKKTSSTVVVVVVVCSWILIVGDGWLLWRLLCVFGFIKTVYAGKESVRYVRPVPSERQGRESRRGTPQKRAPHGARGYRFWQNRGLTPSM